METRSGDIVSALRVMAVWLLTLCVCFGPGRFGASVALAAPNACAACPCAGSGQASHAEAHVDVLEKRSETCSDEHAADYRPGDPCSDDCSDQCPTCACCVGAAMAVFPLVLTSHTTSWSRAHIFVAVEGPVRGLRTRVFRPPRVTG